MYFLALAVDYDGTLAEHGAVDAQTISELKRFKETGRRLLLVTGRELQDLRHAFPELSIFDRVVCENGALIYDPATGANKAIAPPPPPLLIQRLVERNVEPISVGRSIVATWHPHESTVLSVIEELGLELQIIFNKGAVMVLPTGVNKATGLKAALQDLDISLRNVVAVGDAENDHAFLHACGCGAAVANALPSLIDGADIKLSGDHGAGVIELIRRITSGDARLVPKARRGILIGEDRAGSEVYLDPLDKVLIVGSSGSGKSTFATLLAERMVEADAEFSIFDPEGDYLNLDHAACIGSTSAPPVSSETLELVLNTGYNAVVNLTAVPMAERGDFLARLLPSIAELQAGTGRPHCLLIDEAHHFLPAIGDPPSLKILAKLHGSVLITVDPKLLPQHVIDIFDTVIAFGRDAENLIQNVSRLLSNTAPSLDEAAEAGELLVWLRHSDKLQVIKLDSPQQAHTRHRGKYAAGDVGWHQSFFFRGPDNTLSLRAKNLADFFRIASEISDEVWLHHLRAGDFSAWFRGVIKDEDLALEVEEIEADNDLGPEKSRDRIKEAVCRRFIIPPSPE